MTQTNPEPQPQHAAENDDDDYTPVFGVEARRIVYLIGALVGSLEMILVPLSHDLTWPAWACDLVVYLPAAVMVLCGAFGVHYAGVGKTSKGD